ncbi:MAG: nucleotidyltransferase domain-containing protein [Deltaproteobacteria bacterium]|nr:nucleotidyltransferase domain-containing protein [Deltaproteobacteria bacterium]
MQVTGIGRKDIEDILHELKEGLEVLYGDRLVSVILYGSYARGEATADSDIDVAVVLKGEVAPGMEIDRMLDVTTDLSLEYNTLVGVIPVSVDALEKRNSPLLMNLRREGIACE